MGTDDQQQTGAIHPFFRSLKNQSIFHRVTAGHFLIGYLPDLRPNYLLQLLLLC